MGLRVNGGVGNLSFLAMLLMPDATARAQHGTINSGCSPAGGPWLDQVDQQTTQAANLSRQGGWERFQAALPRSPRGEASLLHHQESQRTHFCGRLGYQAQQFMDGVQMTNDHDH
jgi:hypothetical protein